MGKLLHIVLMIVIGISQAQAVLIREDDTDAASLDRAKAYPAVCRLEFMEKGRLKQGTGVLIKTIGSIGWVLTAQHNTCNENYDTIFDVRAHFEDSQGSKHVVKPLACSVPRSGPMGIISCGIEKDLSLIAYDLPSLFNIDPMPLCSSTQSILTHDADAGISRGEGCIVGYGYHGINNKPESFGIDQKKRHASTYFMEYKRRSKNIWSLFSSLSIEPLALGVKSSPFFRDDFKATRDVFMTRFARNESNFLYYDQSDGWNVDPRLIAYETSCIAERIHPLQGLIQGGDSGAPLIVMEGGKPSVLGIVSHEYTDYHLCFKNSRFTPVGYYKSWLDKFLDDSVFTDSCDASQHAFLPDSFSTKPSTIRACLSAEVSEPVASPSSSSSNVFLTKM